MDLSNYIQVWNKLAEGQQSRLLQGSSEKFVKKGTIVHDGQRECTGLLLIQSGQLRAYSLSPEGREITLYRLFEQDICLLSAPCMIRSIQFDIIIEAEKDTRYILIPPFVYKGVMDESAPLANFTNEVMASRLSDVMWLMEQVMWHSFDKRLAGFLLEEAVIEGTDCLKITHETIGNHMGNPREVVTRMLKYFQNEGMVKLSRGTIEITNKKKLEALR